MKKYNAYMPIWFLLILPPLLIFLLAYSFAMSAIGVIAVAFLLKISNPFDEYYKKSLKVFWISIRTSLLIFIMLALPQLLRNVEIIYENFIKHLEYNPYKNVFSFIYMLLILYISFKLTYKSVLKRIINKMEIENDIKKIQSAIVLTFFIVPYLFFIPSTIFINPNKSNLDDFKGTIISDKKSIVELLNNLATTDNINSYFLETTKEPYTINIYVESIENYRKKFEMDAAVIFYLVKDVNEVSFHMEDATYTYTINKINDIFGNIKKKTLSDINNRYSSIQMRDYTYLGRIGKYDLYDQNIDGKRKKQKIYSYNNINYYIECADLEKLWLVDIDLAEYQFIEYLKTSKISIDELMNSDLELIIVGDENNEINSN